jgi:hypothetical protein
MDPQERRLAGLIRLLAERELLTPALCFWASHRPLAFLTAQLLYLLEPLAALAGRPGLATWAALMSDTQWMEQLERIGSTHQTTATLQPEQHGHRQ